MKRTLASALVVAFIAPHLVYAVGSKEAEYIGGTVPGLTENMEGTFSTADESKAVFSVKKRPNPIVEIPYDRVVSLEYGQKAGRRVAVAVLVSPFALFSKKRKHYLTITYNDENGKEQAGVFELGKDIVRTTLTVLQVRTGKDIEYQDEEARKSGMGGK